MTSELPAVDILMTVYNGLPYLEEQIVSIQAQTHSNWRLWVRDDGSDDGTAAVLERLASSDSRIRLVTEEGGGRRGAKGGFVWLLERSSTDAEYTMFADADDRWLPDKIARTLSWMHRAESSGTPGVPSVPTLVHTDLVVVDRDLQPIAGSLWEYQGVDPNLASLNRLLIQNCVTGCTVMINRPLRELSVPVPDGAVLHDWWVALVASCFGRIAHLPEATILYRQHGRNDTGAYRYPTGLREWSMRVWQRLFDGELARRSLWRSAVQARALHDRFGDELPGDTARLLRSFAEIAGCGTVRRRARLLRLGTLPHGAQRTIGLLLRV